MTAFPKKTATMRSMTPSSTSRYVQATVVDHIIPHRGNEVLMWDENNYQALCKECHDRKTGHEDSTPEYRYHKLTD